MKKNDHKAASISVSVALLACCGCGGIITACTDDDEPGQAPTGVQASTSSSDADRGFLDQLRSSAPAAPVPAIPRISSKPVAKPKPKPKPRPRRTTEEPYEPEVYYANCAEVRAAHAAPIHRGQPGYASHLDRDGDGTACDT